MPSLMAGARIDEVSLANAALPAAKRQMISMSRYCFDADTPGTALRDISFETK